MTIGWHFDNTYSKLSDIFREEIKPIDVNSDLIKEFIYNVSKEIKSKTLSNESAKEVGELLGEKLKNLKIKSAVFDRGGYIYHGRVKSLADGVRDKGIEF